MANLILLALTKKDADSISYSQLFDPSRMDDITLNAGSTGIAFKYNGHSYESTTFTSLTSLQNSANTGSPTGGNSVILVYDPSANTGERTIAAHDLLDTNGNVFYLPANSRIVESAYGVVTTFTSATDAATISFGNPTDDVAGIKAATAISTGTTYDDVNAFVAGIQTGAAANYGEVTTAARTVQATVAIEALTAGKLVWFIRYITLPAAI